MQFITQMEQICGPKGLLLSIHFPFCEHQKYNFNALFDQKWNNEYEYHHDTSVLRYVMIVSRDSLTILIHAQTIWRP